MSDFDQKPSDDTHGFEGQSGGPMDGYETVDRRGHLEHMAEERRAREDAAVDEYGIAMPHKSYTERWLDHIYPQEVIAENEMSWFETLVRAPAALGAVVGGHMMDNLPVPILGEISHERQVEEYHHQRAEAEAAAAEEARKAYAPDPASEDAAVCE